MSINKHTDKLGYTPQTLRQWLRSCIGIWNYLRKLSAKDFGDNQGWADAQYQGYWRKFQNLMDNAPKIPSLKAIKDGGLDYEFRNIRRTGTRTSRKASK